MKTLVLVTSLFLAASSHAGEGSVATWQPKFIDLTQGMPRQQAEAEIAKARGVKSAYELWAMDTSDLVAYRLDSRTILLVTYKPGTPAAHVAAGYGHAGHPPVDGTLVSYRLLALQ